MRPDQPRPYVMRSTRARRRLLTLTLTLTLTLPLTLTLTLTQHKGKHGVSAHNKDLFMRRLRRAGVDLSRVGFVQQQPHHRLGLGLGLG